MKFLFLTLLFISANVYAIDYVVDGEIDGYDDKTIYIYDYDTRIKIDSTVVDNGRFHFEGTYNRPAFVRVGNGNVFSECILDTLAVVDFTTHYPLSGSFLNKKLIEFVVCEQNIKNEFDSIANELQNHGLGQQEIYKCLSDKLRPVILSLYSNAIIENPNGVGELAVIKLDGLGITPDEWDVLYSQMPLYLRERQLTARFNDMYITLRNSQPGERLADLNAWSVDGKEVMLSDYIGKGKYVLIDFWASWCAPCREEAENTLRPLYEKYKNDERFQILGVATWDRHERTLEALEKLKYPWPQLIDVGETPMKLYGFNGLPMIFLVDPNGIILKRDLRGDDIIFEVNSILENPL